MNKLQIMALAEIEKRKREAAKKEADKNNLEKWRMNPLSYFEERLNIKADTIDWSLIPGYEYHKWDGTPNPFMKILNSLAAGKWVGVESATGTGKTFNAALIVLWFLECFENSVVVTTAPKEDQLALHLWKEISLVYNKFNKGELRSLKLRMTKGEDTWYAVGFPVGVGSSEESATKAQGFHAEHMLVILEETPGIPSPVMSAFQNTCSSPHNLILALGNPDSQTDSLHRFCLQDNVEHIRISSYDHPNVVLDNPDFIPGAASVSGIKRIISKFGADSAMAKSRTRGISPTESSDSLIQSKWIVDARDKGNVIIDGKEYAARGIAALGVDVANSENGDKAAFARGIGNCLLEIKDFQCPDSNMLAKRDIVDIMNNKFIQAENIGIDSVGVGAGTVNAMKELGHYVKALSGGERATVNSATEDFNNLRSQMYWQLREDLRNGVIVIKLSDDNIKFNELVADLTAPKWETRNGKIIIESKEGIKKRLGHSPNIGDAVVYWNWVRNQHRNQPSAAIRF